MTLFVLKIATSGNEIDESSESEPSHLKVLAYISE